MDPLQLSDSSSDVISRLVEPRKLSSSQRDDSAIEYIFGLSEYRQKQHTADHALESL